MNEKKQDTSFNPLVLRSIYPDASAIFAFQPESLRAVIANCLVVVDTNVLLVPYNTGKESLAAIRKIYSSLAKQNRLIIPGQVAREFAQNRSERLKTVYQQISQKRNITVKRQAYPLLESVSEYQEVVQLEQAIDEKITEYRKAIAKLLSSIGAWHWNDPVSELYKEVFDDRVVFDPPTVEADFLTDLAHRQVHKIPPGYKDASKTDSGVGDLLIWNTVLELGRARGMHVVFVSGDEKADWWHQSENQALFPRFELVDEFRRVSEGKSFHIIGFAELLELFGASSNVIEEVRQEEAIVNLEATKPSSTSPSNAARQVELGVLRWLYQKYLPHNITLDRFSGPDFVVQDGEDRIGYEVKFFHPRAANLDRRLDEAVGRLKHVAGKLTQVYLVCVGEDSATMGKLDRALVRRFLINPDQMIGFIIGILDKEGVFREMARYGERRRPDGGPQ